VTGATDRLQPLALAGPVGGETGDSNFLYLPAIQR
jgi:hypothetical protein